MNALSTAVVTYGIATGISLAVAGLIQLMVMVVAHSAKANVQTNVNVTAAPAQVTASDEAAIAAVIAIAQKC